MTKAQFISILDTYKTINQIFSDLYDIGFDFFENKKLFFISSARLKSEQIQLVIADNELHDLRKKRLAHVHA